MPKPGEGNMARLFSKEFIESQKQSLLKLKSELLNKQKHKDFHIPSDQIIEEGDQAQAYLDQNLNFGLRERDLQRLREIEAALIRIEKGSYGLCEETDEPIEKRRLEKMPWTRLSVYAAEEIERRDGYFKKMG